MLLRLKQSNGFLDSIILKQIIFYIIIFSLALTLPFGKGKNIENFLKMTTPMGFTKRNSFYEMGLNSDDELIFLHSIKSLLKNRQYSSLKLIEKLLSQKHHSEQKMLLLYTYYHQLKYYSLSEEKRVVYLEDRINNDNPTKFTELFNWAIKEFGEVATTKHEHSLIRLNKFPIFHEDLQITYLKLELNTQHFDRVERYISATQSQNQKIRYWGLEHLSKFNKIRVAKYLTLLLDQNNLHSGHLEFANIKETLQKHKSKFPDLYKNSLKAE